MRPTIAAALGRGRASAIYRMTERGAVGFCCAPAYFVTILLNRYELSKYMTKLLFSGHGSIYQIIPLIALSIFCNNVHADLRDEVLRRDEAIWAPAALFCAIELPMEGVNVYAKCPSENKWCFPGEGKNNDKNVATCNDGDMTLFNSLLCLAGYQEGCTAVEASQNKLTGQWFRSPRLATYPRLRTSNSFSPDMALGVLLWVSLDPKARKRQLAWWIDWIGRNQRCVTNGCEERYPRFCPDDDIDGDPEAKRGCALRPGDAATLAVALERFGLAPADKSVGRVLARWKKEQMSLLIASVLGNEADYPQHLAAVNLLLMWKLGATDPALDTASQHLAKEQPKNALFAWLAGKPNEEVAALALDRCPKSVDSLPSTGSRHDWIWQRPDSSDAHLRSMIWDCRFIAGLLRNNTPRKAIQK